MIYSLRDDFFQPRNLQLWDAAIPKKLDLEESPPPPPRPTVPQPPRIFPQPNPDNPWGDPHYLDPPKDNPFNYPDEKFVVTNNLSGQAGDRSGGGGLLGMLLRAMIRQGQVQPGADSASTPTGAPEFNSDSYGSPQGLLGRLLALHNEQAGNAVDLYRNAGAGGARVARTYVTPPQEFTTTPQKPVRILSRRIAG
jgi:hypothetical protein